jgi:hypothetical protein
MSWYQIRQTSGGWRIEPVRESAVAESRLDAPGMLALFGTPEIGPRELGGPEQEAASVSDFEQVRPVATAEQGGCLLAPDVPFHLAWQHDQLRGELRVTLGRDGAVTVCCRATVERELALPAIAWRWRLPMRDVRTLTDAYRWEPLNEPRIAGRLTPLAVTGRGPHGHLAVVAETAVPGHATAPLSKSGIELTVWLDHPLAHPRFTFDGPQFRNWHNAYQLRAGTSLSCTLHLLPSDRPWPLVLPGRYPERCRGLFAITDHADHDSCPKLAALWYGRSRSASGAAGAERREGFVGLKLPFTKSVFTATPERDGPGLHYEPFAELCRAGHRAGIEICPHGIHSTNQPQVSEIRALLEPCRAFGPKTWIDHGNRFLSNYGRRGWNPNDEFSLLPWLDDLGIRYVWGRIDFGHALPGGRLNQLAVQRFRGLQYLHDLPRSAWRAMRICRPWAALHGASSLAFQLLPEPTMMQYFRAQRAIQRVMRADVSAIPTATWNTLRMAGALAVPPGAHEVWRHLMSVREEISFTPVFFPEHHAVTQGSTDRWLFNTLAVHDVAEAYAPQAIDDLIEEYGLHLSHTYLTSVSRAHLSHAVEPDGADEWRLTKPFAANLQALAERRDAGQLWVASMAEIGDFWSARNDVKLEPVGFGTWKISRAAGGVETPLAMQWVTDATVQQVHWRDERLRLESLHDGVKWWAKRLGAGEEIEVSSHEA